MSQANVTVPAAGPASDAGVQRANMPPPDLRGNAREAAKAAMRAATEAASPKTPEAAPSAEGVPAAPVEDSTSTPAGGSEEAGITPPEPEIDVKTRVKQREMRIQRELAEQQSRLAAERARFDAERQSFESERQKYQRLDHLKRTDPIAWAKEIELDSVMEPIVKARILAGKPEGQVLTLEQKIAAMERERQEERQQIQQQMQQAQVRASHQQYATLTLDAAKFPTLAAVYADDPGELVADALKIQRHLMMRRKTNDLPQPSEIAEAHERYIREVAQRAAKVKIEAKPAAPVAETTKVVSFKAKIPSPSDATRTAPIQRNERIQTDRERKDAAALAAKKAIASTVKRTPGQR